MKQLKVRPLALAFVAMTMTSGAMAGEWEQDDALALIELIDTLNQEALSLPQAVEFALKQQPGLVQEARVEWNDERIHFEIEITSGRDVYQLEIDPSESKVLNKGLNLGETVVNHMASSGDFIFGGNALSAERQGEITAMLKTGLTQIEGKPIALSLEEERGRIFYEVLTLAKGRLSTAVISGQTGKIIFYRHYSNDD
ncbi:PepSY domain-containing protein [Pelagibius sp. Alg239-R121]|uniref:PepSY domain-containing protein n=1 Tax=Pelagibius sp. Alg239-R121 TaxID=2993448 RepID=UPI0024A79D67|nr:PepSY domain-containing protein [Pelagibius sp. Alg239-R121]